MNDGDVTRRYHCTYSTMRRNVNPKAKVRGPRQNSRKQQGTGGSTVATVPSQAHRLVPSYPKQVCWDVTLPGVPAKSTTVVTTGLIAGTYAISSAAIQAFATRFGSTFVEFRIVSARLKVKFFSSTNPGVIQMWYDEKVTSVPTLVEAQERYIVSASASQVDRPVSLMWVAQDPLDLQYLPIGTVTQVCTFKLYTNNANFGSSIVATDYCETESDIRIQFRGLQGV